MASSSANVATVMVLSVALLFLCLHAAADSSRRPDTVLSDALFLYKATGSATAPLQEGEVNQHVGRTAAIFFSVFGGVWLILSLFLAYFFIYICPERHTK
ncbi:hypothetical protein ABB37_02667 [Leptomonas pyrrhocoris]|uniref:Uncharacterized protein n=1 Tax=Leptomonas pyrrhocoris TaxID=157538 RepID=A0A0N0DXF2_LEPPY|nr:hypothetical protein ABB37_02667 [Leptomonas pyrrhocoris]KPA82915.1 hypothetical protein ABB37_02667 [Leptomonas pyrrhocoris]|eukprot:XP_015661354.1 hypothetical protein ABB37_02667 [Leptomonas pyrrhocoris]